MKNFFIGKKRYSGFCLLSVYLLCLAFFFGTGCTQAEKPNSVVVGITQEPGIFDPHTAVAAGDKEILFNIYEGLVRCTPEGEFLPCLATEVSISDDAMTYLFTLREDVVFHDNTPMTAEDVQYSLLRASGALPGVSAIPMLDAISDVAIDEKGRIAVHLSEPDPDMLPFFSVAIVPAHHGDLQREPIGTGPFVWRSYSVGQSVILDRNDHYRIPELPYLDSVTFKITANVEAAFLELQSGSIDIFPYLPIDNVAPLEDRYQMVTGSMNMVQIFALNNARAPFDNPLVRKAMNLAVDRHEILVQTAGSDSRPLMSGMSPALRNFFNEELEDFFPRDLEAARECLTEAGYPDGFSTTITVPSNYTIHVNTALLLQQQLLEVGIRVEILPVDWPTWIEDTYSGRNYDTTVIALTSEFHPADVLSRYRSDNGNNFINYANENFDRDFAAIRSETDSDKRIELYRNLQRYLAEDAASVFLQDPNTIVAVKKSLTGYYVFPMYVQDMSTVRFVD